MAFAISAAVGAVSAAIAVTTVATVLTAVSAVGLAMTVVGVVTGSKELTKLGGTLGLVGGLGSLANAAFTNLTGAAVSSGAGVAEGAAADAYSDVAGEIFQQGTAGGINGVNAVGSDVLGSATASLADGTASGIAGTTLESGLPALDAATASQTGVTAPAVSGAAKAAATAAEAAKLGTDPSTLDNIIKGVGKAWESATPQTKAELVKAALAIPGGIQNQKNTQAQLDLQKQRVAQTSYGSDLPTFGIIQKAQQKGT